MTKKMIIALVLIAVAALILLFNNKGSASVELWVTTMQTAKALVYFCWLALGVIIGVLLGK